MQQILKEHGIPASGVLAHGPVYTYARITMFTLVLVAMSKQSIYPLVLKWMLERNETLLGLGCGFRQEQRPLVAAGVPAVNLFGLDVVDAFTNLGIELFKDEDVLGLQFLIPNLLKGFPAQVEGKTDII